MKIKLCHLCHWGAKKTEKGYSVYSGKKFHHVVIKGSSDEKFFKKNLCPIHGTKLK